MSIRSERGPLAGLKVVDWTHVLAGPFAGYQLALLGADVIRIERPRGEDIIRAKAADPELAALGLGEAFVCQGSGKRSLAIDAKDPRARAALARLIASADVLLENFRPGKLAALGFDPARLLQQHPQLVVCSITGFGPESDRRAYDHVVQAASGLMAANRNAQGQPQRIGFPVIDYAVGQQAALAVLAALYRRDARQRAGDVRTSGEWLQVSMAGAALTLLAPAYADSLVSGIERPRSASTAFSGSPLSGTFEVADGWFAIVCNAPAQGEALRSALHEAGCDSALLAQLDAAVAAVDVVRAQQVLGQMFRTRSAADWDERLARWGVPATAVRRPAEAAAEAAAAWPRVRLPATASKPARDVAVPGIGFTSSKLLTPSTLSAPARRGQDSRAILTELGCDAATIDALVAAGQVAEP